MDFPFTRADIRDALGREPSPPVDDMLWLGNATPELRQRIRARIPERRIPAAVLVPLIERPSGWTVLLTQRATDLLHHAGQVSFPGGRIESDDHDAEAAALREADEEVGLQPAKVRVIGQLRPYLTRTGFHITPIVGVVSPPLALELAPGEVAEAFEVPLADIVDPRNHLRHEIVIEGRAYFTHVIPSDNRFIWGATAAMLVILGRILAPPEAAAVDET